MWQPLPRRVFNIHQKCAADLFFLQHVGLPQNLHGVNVPRVFLLHQTDLRETTSQLISRRVQMELSWNKRATNGVIVFLKKICNRTSPKAPRPITFRDSKSSKPSRVRFSRKNSVSLRACCERRITFCKTWTKNRESTEGVQEKDF